MRNLLSLIAKNYFVLLFIMLEGLSLLFVFQFNPYQKSLFVSFSRSLNAGMYERLGNAREYLYLKEENERLLIENTRLRNLQSQNTRTITIKESTTEIPDTSISADRWTYYFISADVINNSVNKQYNYLTINKGYRQGVGKDMAVISSDGVVGVIAGVSQNFATVIPVLNRNFRVGSKIARNDYFGILEWDGRNPENARLREIPLHVEVRRGDEVVTSGFSSIFPPDFKVGIVESFRVTEGNFYEINVRLSVNFRTLNHVNVVGNIFSKEQQELENSFGYD